MVCVVEQGWNKTLQGCSPPGTEFDTPVLVSLFNFFMVIYIFQLYLFIYLLYVYHDVTPDCICAILKSGKQL